MSPYRSPPPPCPHCPPGENICIHGPSLTVQITRVSFVGRTYLDAAYLAYRFFMSGGQIHPSVTSVELKLGT